ncbi:alpha/beta hydrolase family protein [Pseudomonas neustonica]|uniref:Alpha/beta fold hydrolase n=1 Tax=Pseudomonas neustonica TaxID=2487346 RepID=A0ABX9XML7_9PSED|nr:MULTISPECIES: alpha/beta fold hydrolase [Pseudomonas]ROZ84611.1 alpha/beta fold hydrolase [Pseudomonas sp. SSM44]ROZ86415.1 alpha/beta fold hydrolase [Pseudomonas neustonica]
MNSETIASQALTLTAADGYPLSATLYPASQPIGQLLVGSATGVPQGFYRRFAEYAASRGYSTLTLDYRGIGGSAPASLRGFDMDYLDWAELDLAAGVDYLKGGDLPLYMVGHSFGGHAFGLLPNHSAIGGLYTFGTGAGWHGWMPRSEQLRVLLMWRVIGPLIVRSKGYLAWRKLGMGEDLPKGVYQKWKRWCRFPRYFFEDPHMPGLEARFGEVTTPLTAVSATDDLWASPASRDAFMSAYRNADYTALTVDPLALNLRPLGHMGYFRAHAEPLWHGALDWFDQLTLAAKAA